jgi:hypothetical protein
MQKLTKSEFMSKVINDTYAKKFAEKEKSIAADIHIIQNFHKIQRRNR